MLCVDSHRARMVMLKSHDQVMCALVRVQCLLAVCEVGRGKPPGVVLCAS